MSNVTIGSVAVFGALIGGMALIQIKPTIGPFNFTRESPLLSEDDEQRARALRIAAEQRAERTAASRANVEKQMEEEIRKRKTTRGIRIGFCKWNLFDPLPLDPETADCIERMTKVRCSPTAVEPDWSLNLTWYGVLEFLC